MTSLDERPAALHGDVIRPSANGLVDDPDWCGHTFVSLRDWACPDCGRAATAATRRRLESQPTAPPPGYVWAVETGWQDPDAEDGYTDTWLLGVFTDRRRIPALLVRRRYIDARSLRETLARIHWYQGVFNPWCFEGWAESPCDDGRSEFVDLSTRRLDGVGFDWPPVGMGAHRGWG